MPAPDDWDSVRFTSSSTGSVMDNTVVRYGGGEYSENVYVATTDVTFTNNTVAWSSWDGLRLDNALPASLTGNSFLNNKQSAVWAPLTNNTQSITLSGNTASGNPSGNAFVVAGSIGGNVTWDGDDNFPFEAWNDLTVNVGARLTLAPRTILKFHDYWDALIVNGTLIADTDAANPIYFTSFKDDVVGGDTNADGNVTTPTPNDWDSVRFAASSTGSVMDNTVVRYGGGEYSENIWTESAGLALTNSTVASSSDIGLSVRASAPTVTGNTFTGNIRGVYTYENASPVLRSNRITGNRDWGVQNASSGVIIDAQQNWWGNVTGPYDPSDDRASGGLYNPGGKGDKVSDRVDYDPWQRITGLRYGVTISTGSNPSQTIRYTYDTLSRVVGLAASGPASFVREYTYDAASRLTASGPASGQPGVRTTYSYDDAWRMTRVTQRNPSGSITFNDLQYTFDKSGSILTVSDGSGTTSFTYDALNQLASVSGPGLSETYTYDTTGNRLTKGSLSYTYNAANQLVSASDGTSYTYDLAGNLRTRVKSGQTTYSWDGVGRLIRIDFPDATYTAYGYDELGNRISKRDRAGVMTYYVYDGMNLAQEVDASGTVLAVYVHDGLDRPVSMTRGGVTYHYLLDRLGNVLGLTDGAGTLVISYRYDPWGNVIATGGSNTALVNPFRFSGREWDAESGFYFFRARFYDPAVGRFISRDPVFGSLTVPRSLNPYLYVQNNPTNWTDRSGELLPLLAIVVPVAVVGGAIALAVYTINGLGHRAHTEVEGVEVINLQSKEGKQLAAGLNGVGAAVGIAQQAIPGPSSEATSGLSAVSLQGQSVEKTVMAVEQTTISVAGNEPAEDPPDKSAQCTAPPKPKPESAPKRLNRWMWNKFGDFGEWLYNKLD